LASYVILSNYSGGAAGVALPTKSAAHIMLTGGEVSSSVIAHEIGHNLGLLHAERYNSKSELVLSDESEQIEYGNPYSVMGDASIDNNSGDLTIISKVGLELISSVGYTAGSTDDVDVLQVDKNSINSDAIQGFTELNAEANNTFRIYRSNYGIPPLRLKESNFTVELPSETSNRLKDLNSSPFGIVISGTGEEANGTLQYDLGNEAWVLSISDPGRGFVEEPSIRVLNDDNTSLFVLDPTWIVENFGIDYNQTATLVDKKKNWLRGIQAKTDSELRPSGTIATGLGALLTDYYLSYRTDIATNGLTLNITNSEDEEVFEPFLLDATPNTPRQFLDGEGALLLGKTYSDYDADGARGHS